MNKILETRHLVKTYKNGSTVVHALDDVSFSISQGDLAVILGKSGSGKSTLLDTIGGIEKPDQGEVLLNGISLYELRENERANIRSSCIGYIFQTFNLIEELTALENIRLPQDICGRTYEKQLEQDICTMLEIEARLHFYPDQLSGGERQRVAIARALLMKPQIVLADEPAVWLVKTALHLNAYGVKKYLMTAELFRLGFCAVPFLVIASLPALATLHRTKIKDVL